MWVVRHGKRKNENKINYKDNTYMSKLRKTVVNFLDEIGERSGCHRIPERSFFFKGHQFPVCARCTGVCIGQFSAILINYFITIPIQISFLFLTIMGLDWGVQELKIKASTNFRRLVTGILGGFGLFSFYCKILKIVSSKFIHFAVKRKNT